MAAVLKHPDKRKLVQRVLMLIDVMAPLRRYYTTEAVAELLNERANAKWHKRTVYRDLETLEGAGLVERVCIDKRFLWRLKLRRTENQQRAAIELDA